MQLHQQKRQYTLHLRGTRIERFPLELVDDLLLLCLDVTQNNDNHSVDIVLRHGVESSGYPSSISSVLRKRNGSEYLKSSRVGRGASLTAFGSTPYRNEQDATICFAKSTNRVQQRRRSQLERAREKTRSTHGSLEQLLHKTFPRAHRLLCLTSFKQRSLSNARIVNGSL